MPPLTANPRVKFVQSTRHEQDDKGQRLGSGVDPLVPAIDPDKDGRSRFDGIILAVNLKDPFSGNNIGELIVSIMRVLANKAAWSYGLHTKRVFMLARGGLIVE
jgi:hypothetical protein